MNTLKHFVLWVDVAIEQVTNKKILGYIDFLLDKGLSAKTINCHLDSIRGFYEYLCNEEEVSIPNPVKRGYALRLSRPLPRYLRDEHVAKLFGAITSIRDRAIFMLMLRCGLRVEEVADLKLAAIDSRRRRITVQNGKGGKGRVVYMSNDSFDALLRYLAIRPSSQAKRIFLVEKGNFSGKPLSVRGIQKRIEYYARKTGVKVSCHHLRHTMATQLLNADADLVTIQDLLGHTRIKTTQRYCRVSNLKVERDYFKAIELVMQRTKPSMEGGEG
jgi:site-specific recombinase XerD